jgi:2-iminobutanoate/2-iminopropanoate deaminase
LAESPHPGGTIMSRRHVIELPDVKHKAPIPTAVVIDNVLASSAVFGADPANGELPEAAADEIANVFANIRKILKMAGATSDDVLRMDVLLRDSDCRDIVNKQWLAMFPDENDRPARHITVVGNLPARAQIEFLAVLPGAPEKN